MTARGEHSTDTLHDALARQAAIEMRRRAERLYRDKYVVEPHELDDDERAAAASEAFAQAANEF